MRRVASRTRFGASGSGIGLTAGSHPPRKAIRGSGFVRVRVSEAFLDLQELVDPDECERLADLGVCGRQDEFEAIAVSRESLCRLDDRADHGRADERALAQVDEQVAAK